MNRGKSYYKSTHICRVDFCWTNHNIVRWNWMAMGVIDLPINKGSFQIDKPNQYVGSEHVAWWFHKRGTHTTFMMNMIEYNFSPNQSHLESCFKQWSSSSLWFLRLRWFMFGVFPLTPSLLTVGFLWPYQSSSHILIKPRWDPYAPYLFDHLWCSFLLLNLADK